MTPLLAKELRLLRPAYGMALLLAVVPVWVLPDDRYHTAALVALVPFCFGAAMLALSTFGREFALNTFPLIMAQPLERERIWRTKIAVLAGAMVSVFAAWWLSCVLSGKAGHGRPIYDWLSLSWHLSKKAGVELGLGQTEWSQTFVMGVAIVAVTFSGGLWATLLLRQVSAAFWFTLLVPGAIAINTAVFDGTRSIAYAALAVYSAAGFWWARRQFFRAQAVGWTGGVVALPWGRADGAIARSSGRAHRPLAALFWKELQLHQVALVGMGCLFLLHLGIVVLRKAGHETFGNATRSALEVFGGVWLLAPLLVAAPSVAEERKLGTAQTDLCLPISSRLQFVIKLLFVLVLGGLLSALLLWTAEWIGGAIGAPGDIGGLRIASGGRGLACLSLAFLALSLLSFYASTLTRNVVQALAAAVVTTLGVWMLVAGSVTTTQFSGFWLWRGFLVAYFGCPVMVATFVWLAYRNFRFGSEGGRVWSGNLLRLSAALVLVAVSTTAVYHRVWELVMPLEPARGPVRLTGPKPASLHSFGGSALTLLLPDGRLWADRLAYDLGRAWLGFNEETGFRVEGKWRSLSGNHPIPGTNWVDAVANFYETVAIRSDGTLWVSEKPRQRVAWDDAPPVENAAGLVRFGNETRWRSVVRDYKDDWRSVILLKQDGTLWRWSSTSNAASAKPKNWPGLRAVEPHQLGTESDWAKIFSAGVGIYAWKTNGRASVIFPPGQQPGKQNKEIETDTVLRRLESFDQVKWRGLTQCWPFHAGVREDGTLWAWTIVPPSEAKDEQGFTVGPALQIGKDTDWVAAGGDYNTLAALKADGSIWAWYWPMGRRQPLRRGELLPYMAATAPSRLGHGNDWVGVGGAWGGLVSLAADGSLWYWWNRSDPYASWNSDQPMMAVTRRPSRIENVLGGPE